MSECSAVAIQKIKKVFLSINPFTAPVYSLHTGLNDAGSCGFGGPELSAGPISLYTHISEEIPYLKTFSFVPIKENFHMP